MNLSPSPGPSTGLLTSHYGAGPQNTNIGSGYQTNSTISGGTYNQQFNGPTTIQQSLRAKTPPLPLIIVLFPRDDGFVVHPEFAKLQDKLSKTGTRVALTGLGGVG